MDNLYKKENIQQILERILTSKILLGFVVLIFLVKISTSLLAVNLPKNIFFADITRTALINMLNETRENSGLQPLTENQKLDQAAQLKAEDMVQKEYFAHTSPAGISPWYWFSQTGYKYKYAGENLAVGFYESEEAFNAWLDSPSHKANILNKNYKEVGTAVLTGYGLNNAIVVVQLFGSQQQVAPTKITETPKPAEPVKQETVVVPNNIQETTETPTTTLGNNTESTNNPQSRFLNSLLYNYDAVLQDITYGFLMVITGILMALILMNLNLGINAKKQLIFRSVMLIALLSVSIIAKDIIILLIPLPHQIII